MGLEPSKSFSGFKTPLGLDVYCLAEKEQKGNAIHWRECQAEGLLIDRKTPVSTPIVYSFPRAQNSGLAMSSPCLPEFTMEKLKMSVYPFFCRDPGSPKLRMVSWNLISD